MNQLQVAVVGCGHMGSLHARVVAAHAGSRLAATVDLNPVRAVALADRYGAVAMARVPPNVDVVVVATPTETHVELASVALRRGQRVMVEKPVCLHPSEAALLISSRCGVAHVERYNPAIRAVPDLRPNRIDARREGPWTGRCGAIDVVLDLMVHDLDLVLQRMTPVVWVKARGSVRAGTDQVEQAFVEIGFQGGEFATFSASRVASEARREWVVHGERSGVLDLLRGRAVIDGAEVLPPETDDALTAQWRAFYLAAMTGEPAPVPVSEALRAVRLAHQIRSSMVILGEVPTERFAAVA